MVTRDPMEPGSSICSLGGIGAAHHFHSRNLEPDEDRHRADEPFSAPVAWPDHHSGNNGDYQRVRPVGGTHPVPRDHVSPTGAIQYLPAHPHEGAVSAPPHDPTSRVILEGRSRHTGRTYTIAAASEAGENGGRALAQSTFHHFADYNWDPAAGCPSFVTERPSPGMLRFPEALRSTKRYVRNLAFWLSG